MNRDIPARRKKASGALLGFYLLTFYIFAFTQLMHGGTHTNWFNFRYSFVFSFLMICIAAEEFQSIFRLSKEEANRCGVVLLVSTILALSVSYEYLIGGAVVLDLALLVLMWMLVRIHQKSPRRMTEKALAGLLLLTVSVNLFANFTLSVLSIRDWEKDLTQYKANVLFTGSSVQALKQTDSSFFRMENDVSESGTLGVDDLLYGYNGVGYSGPAMRAFVNEQLNRIGINWFDMRHWYQAGVPAATDTLLGLKYIVASRTDVGEEKDYPKIVHTPENAVYQNPNALGIAALVDSKTSEVELGSNVFENLNEVWKKMSGLDQNIFTVQQDVSFTLHNQTDSLSISSREIETSVSNTAAGVNDDTPDTTYAVMEFKAEKTGPVYRCDTSVPESEAGSTGATMKYCGFYRAGETVRDTASAANTAFYSRSQFLNFCSHIIYAYADNTVLAEHAREVNAREITFNAEHENQLNGTFTAEKSQRILFTIPWDEGWTCYIDGEKVPVEKTWDLFMSVEAPEGEHTWEMKFFPAWMDYGLYLCGAALLGLAALMVLWKRSDGKNHCDSSHNKG